MKRNLWRLWEHTIAALITHLDTMLAPPPHDTLWVPEAHPRKPRAWDDTDD